MRCRSALTVLIVALACGPAGAEPTPAPLGEAFGQPVTAEEFGRFHRTAQLFTRTGLPDGSRTDQAIREEAWKNLVLAREAARLTIEADPHDVDETLRRLIAQRGGDPDSPGYAAWLAQTLQESPESLRSRVEDLVRINALIRQHTPPIEVTDAELEHQLAYDSTAVESEYIRFDRAEDAQAFADQVQRDPSAWKPAYDAKQRAEGARGAAWINLMTLPALRDYWKFPPESLARLASSEPGRWLLAEHLYGPVVVRVLQVRRGSLNQASDDERQAYRRRLIDAKQEQAAQRFVADVFKRANVQEYARALPQPADRVSPPSRRP